MESRNNDNTQVVSAAKADISERSGRNIEHNKGAKQQGSRPWVTRKDPFQDVWKAEIVPMLEQGIYEATFVLNELHYSL